MGILFVDDGDFFERSFYQDLIQLVSIYSFLTESNAQKAFELAGHLSVHEMWPSLHIYYANTPKKKYRKIITHTQKVGFSVWKIEREKKAALQRRLCMYFFYHSTLTHFVDGRFCFQLTTDAQTLLQAKSLLDAVHVFYAHGNELRINN